MSIVDILGPREREREKYSISTNHLSVTGCQVYLISLPTPALIHQVGSIVSKQDERHSSYPQENGGTSLHWLCTVATLAPICCYKPVIAGSCQHLSNFVGETCLSDPGLLTFHTLPTFSFAVYGFFL